MTNPIKCEFRKLPQFVTTKVTEETRLKCGKYHSSVFWDIKGFGYEKWALGAYLEGDFEQLINDGATEKEIIEGCLQFLNKKRKNSKKPKYGNLSCRSYDFKEKDGRLFISALLITDDKNNKNFWGKGERISY